MDSPKKKRKVIQDFGFFLMLVVQIGYCGGSTPDGRLSTKTVKIVVQLKVIFGGVGEGICPLSTSPPGALPLMEG